MRKFTQLFLVFSFLFISFGAFAQNEMTNEELVREDMADDPMAFATPKDMWELTPNFGTMFLAGDMPANIGFGGGLSIRKSTDYLFSLRLDLLAGKFSGDNENIRDEQNVVRSYETSWFSGTVYGVFSLNSIRFDRSVKKTNLYAMIGVGGNYFDLEEWENETKDPNDEFDPQLNMHMGLGAGVSFRLSRRINLGLEHQVILGFGNQSDRMDGLNTTRSGGFTPFRDVLNYTNLRIGINLGNFNKRSEPKYWINPMEVVLNEVDQLREAQAANRITDSDGDGVMDQFDEEPGSEPNAFVDTRGRTLDSDNDGIPDHIDIEPYITPRSGESIDSEGQIIRPEGITESRVQEMIEEAFENYDSGSGLTDLYLPMVHFELNSATLRYADYGTLAGIGQVLRKDPALQLVVLGYTDQTGNADYNMILSYRRAKAVIDHLVSKHNIDRSRLILQYGGQDDQLVPQNRTYMNRRVEFKLPDDGDSEMSPPEGYTE